MFAIVSVVKYFWKNRSDFIALCRLRHCTSIVEHVRTFQLRMYDQLVLLSARGHTSHLRLSINVRLLKGALSWKKMWTVVMVVGRFSHVSPKYGIFLSSIFLWQLHLTVAAF